MIRWKKIVTRETTLLERYLRMIGYANGLGTLSNIKSKNILTVSKDCVSSQYFDEEEIKKAGEMAVEEYENNHAQKVIKEYLKDDVDEIYGDRVGNLFSVINPNSEFKIMLAGHIDQIGFQVSHIDKKGYLWFLPLGGFDPSTLPGKRVKVYSKGNFITGVLGKKPIHLISSSKNKNTFKYRT